MFRSTLPAFILASVVFSGCSGSPLAPMALSPSLSVAPVVAAVIVAPLAPVVTSPVTPEPVAPVVIAPVAPTPDPLPPVRTPVISPAPPISCVAPAFAMFRDTQWTCETVAAPPVVVVCPDGFHAILGASVTCEVDGPIATP